MAGTVSIAALRPSSSGGLLRARLFKCWPAQRSGERPFGQNFVVIDAEGAAILGYVNIGRFNRMLDVFVEGRTLEFRRFSVERMTLERIKKGYLPVSSRLLFVINDFTSVDPIPEEIARIPRFYFEFRQLEELGTAALPEHTLADLLGRISGFGPISTVTANGRSVRVRHFFLANERSCEVEVVLWDRFVDLFPADELVVRSRDGPVLIACSSLQARKRDGVLDFTTFLGTRFFFDIDCAEAAQLRSA